MSHFYAVIHSLRKPATKTGSQGSGLQTVAAGWNGAIETTLTYDKATGRDTYRVRLIPWQSHGSETIIASGVLDAQIG